MIQSRGINDHKRLRFIPHYLTLLDSKYIHDLALFLAATSHFSSSHSFITHSFSPVQFNMIPTFRFVLHSLACICVLPHITLTPKQTPREWAFHYGDIMGCVASTPAIWLHWSLLADFVCKASYFLWANFYTVCEIYMAFLPSLDSLTHI